MSIFCCGTYHEASEKRVLQDTEKFENRYIEVVICPKCGKKKALLSQRRIVDGKLIERYSKKGQADKFIKKWSSSGYEDGLKQPKNGTYNDMNWLYSIGMVNKQPSFKILDFNEVERDRFKPEVKIFRMNTNRIM